LKAMNSEGWYEETENGTSHIQEDYVALILPTINRKDINFPTSPNVFLFWLLFYCYTVI